MDLGLSLSGIEIIQSLEIDAQASMTLRANLPHDVLNMDIKDIRVGDQPGSFIQALRSGRLYSAYLRADTTNVQYFYIYMNFIFKEIPIHVLPPIMSII